jgi:dienelactone hydrolase
LLIACVSLVHGEPPTELRPWLELPQAWQRDTGGPILSLGPAGSFDDTHVFAPMVAREANRFQLWYCGSTGAVEERVFQLGLATSRDGCIFDKHEENPVYSFGDGKHSVLTPTLLRNGDGSTLREDGKLRMWFSSTWFAGDSTRHTLHEATSDHGITWSEPSPSLLDNVYAPTVIKDGRQYRMWYCDVEKEPWIIRHAASLDGRRWRVSPEPCLVIDQPWERTRLVYPTVLKIDDVYLMWYGSYWSARSNTTALGFAASLNGLKWYKHPQNPVFRPDPNRAWESHYVTSQSVMRLPDGSYRIWYASRKEPPFVNKYFAINTARWQPGKTAPPAGRSATDAAAFRAWQLETRGKLRKMLGIPSQRVPLDAERRGEVVWDGIVIEKWVFTSEPGSRVPAVLYRPKDPPERMPAIVLTFGHGGSKSQWQYNYAGQLYARLGLACLALDPLGEEERHREGRLGTRAHDPKPVSDRADAAGRLIMGKLVFDTIRGIDFLIDRDDVAHDRIGVAGNSLGGAKASWMAAVEPRIRMAIVSGWAYHDVVLQSKYCTRLPGERMRELLSWTDFAALAAPHCALLIANGDADWVIDKGDAAAWEGTRQVVSRAATVYRQLGATGGIQAWFEPDGGHRPYFIYKIALEWIHQHLGTPAMSLDQIRDLPTVNSGQWCDRHGVRLEKLYGTPLHQRGATLPDLGIQPTPREVLSCLNEGELGAPEFTVEGWLQQIEE